MRDVSAGTVSRRRRAAHDRRSARRDHGRDRPRPRGPAAHGCRAEPQHRLEHRAQGVSHATRQGRSCGSRRIRDRAVEMISRYDVKTPGPDTPAQTALGRQPAEGRPRARVLERAAGARRRRTDPRPRRRRDRDRARLPPRGGRAAGRGAADQRGPRRGVDAVRPDRGHVRGRDRRRGRRDDGDGRGDRAADGRRQERKREPAGSADREAPQATALADGRGAARVARRRAHRDRDPARRHRAFARDDVPAAVRRRLPRRRRADEHADRGDTARVHGPRGSRRVPHAPVQHRRRRSALLRRDRRRRDGAAPARLRRRPC